MRTPAAKAAIEKDWKKLKDIGCWDLTSVREYDDVRADALTAERTVHFGCVYQSATKSTPSSLQTSVYIRAASFSKATKSKTSPLMPLYSRIYVVPHP